jgi:hypothetical protein
MRLVWNDKKFKRHLLDTLESNSELVGEFVRADAKNRLMAIRTPAWGAGYRQQIVARLLGYEVERKSNEVVVNVGVKKSGGGDHHGFYIETGSKTAPAQPFLRPAVFGNGQTIANLFIGK